MACGHITVKERIPIQHVHRSSPLLCHRFAYILAQLVDRVRHSRHLPTTLPSPNVVDWDMMLDYALRNGVGPRCQQECSAGGSKGRLHGCAS
ncbi:hypothetical protein B0T14DRAFT_135556 [Immersiella caudata]|uniref:Uncharacterized protein n=1 Tax=Immersiella caudata TaxID=314043 RepID=A0AA39X564_9PEZI|nr:hypothetical protein B0T14DRAFT_135556 [Immersiella caudata]